MLYYTSSPNKYIDIGEVLDLKIDALARHESQFPDRVLLEFLVKVNAMLYGKLAGVSYAEGFKVIPVDLLHVAPFVERI
jgi:LmbE family N-acetylglucosaminyl deacetylase